MRWTVLVGGLAALMAMPAARTFAEDGLDGEWMVTQTADNQACPHGYSFRVRIAGGKIAYVGNDVLQAQGGVSPGGKVNISFAFGSFLLKGTGGLNGHSGSGRWGVANCAGGWQAEKQ